jgi:radial spoke head protein 4/6
LRAQIARISHGTVIIPKGLLEFDEEGNAEKYAEEFAVPGTEELKSLEAWGHRHQCILKVGRISHLEPQGSNEEDKEAYLAAQGESDPALERYKGINEDTPVFPGMEAGWTSKLVGDPQPYNYKDGTTTYAVNVLKSLRWPGALTVAQNGKFASIYVGYGLKRGDVCFNPTEPPEVQRDPSDQNEQPEVSAL